MYYGLRLKMFENDVSIDAIAKLLCTHRNTISNKIHGDGDFKCRELHLIRDTFFPDVSLDELMSEKKGMTA
jgi:hypothetical protein